MSVQGIKGIPIPVYTIIESNDNNSFIGNLLIDIRYE